MKSYVNTENYLFRCLERFLGNPDNLYIMISLTTIAVFFLNSNFLRIVCANLNYNSLTAPLCFFNDVIKVSRQSRKTLLLLYCLFFVIFFSFPLPAFCDFSAICHRIFLIFGQLIDNNLTNSCVHFGVQRSKVKVIRWPSWPRLTSCFQGSLKVN